MALLLRALQKLCQLYSVSRLVTGHWISPPANEVMCDKRSASNKRSDTLHTLHHSDPVSSGGSSKLLPTWWEPWSLLITSVLRNIIFNNQLSITLLLLWSTSDDLFLSDTVYKKDESSLTPHLQILFPPAHYYHLSWSQDSVCSLDFYLWLNPVTWLHCTQHST